MTHKLTILLTHKARVRAECYGDPTLMSDYTPYLDTYLEPIPVPEYECGKVFEDREITNLELKHTFAPGEIVESKNGDTRYEIIFSEEKNGYLSGQFFMIMDCWGGAKIRCEFSKTQINTDNIVLKTIFHNVPDSTLYVKPETIRKENTLIQGKNGEDLVLTKKGQVMGKTEFNATGGNSVLLKEYHRKSDSLAQWQINFSKYDAQTYAFDYLGSGNHGIFSSSEYYPQVGSYDFRYKSVECGKNDKVIVEFDTYPQADSVVFKDKYGVTYPVSLKDNVLSFTGVSKADTNYIYAYRGDKKVGKLFLNTYQRKIYKVVFVRVNGAAKKLNEEKVQEHLNKVYNQCAVKFEIETAKLDLPDLTSFSHGGSGILTVYNEDQKKVLRAYDKEMKDGVYYLFFVDNVTDKKDGSGTPVSGYMPRGYNCGFIYDGGSERTIAHELGHGIGNLEHVFENSNNSGKTANLMDYANGEELWHFQWDQIQDPSRVWMKWNKDESEGEWTTDGHYYLFTYLGMLMDMNPATAELYGKWAEEPDSKVINAGDMEENITWLIGNLQQRNHALTGGEHGVELAATAYAITHYLTNDNQKYLFHRFGDCYAHLNISNDSKGFDNVALKDYIDAFENYIKGNFSFVRPNTEQLLMSDGKIITIQPNDIIYDKRYITSIPRDKFIQMLLRKILTADSEGGLESKNKSAFRFNYTTYSGVGSYWQKVYGEYEYEYSEIVSDLKNYLPKARQNSYEMYGANQEGPIDSWCTMTTGHSFAFFSNPDAIINRSELFKLYSTHAAELLSIICKIDEGKAKIASKNVSSIVDLVKKATNGEKNARLDGVWSFHIFFTRLMLGEKIKTFKIPIKYLPISSRNNQRVVKFYDLIADWDQFVNDLDDWMGVEDAEAQVDVLIRYLRYCKAYNIYNLRNIKIRKPYQDESQRCIIIEVIQM